MRTVSYAFNLYNDIPQLNSRICLTTAQSIFVADDLAISSSIADHLCSSVHISTDFTEARVQ